VTYTEGQKFDLHHDAGSLDIETGKYVMNDDAPCKSFYVHTRDWHSKLQNTVAVRHNGASPR
jgi:hypothetical protein